MKNLFSNSVFKDYFRLMCHDGQKTKSKALKGKL